MTRTALLSVYNKDGIVKFAKELVGLGWTLYASGGTCRTLANAGVPVTDVAELVGGEAILGHRVVTLSREVHAGLLSRAVYVDLAEMEELGLPFIDLVCVDLYPLTEEIAKPDSTPDSVLEKTDVGGPTMLHSAAKGRRVVISVPAMREAVLTWLKAGEPEPDRFRLQLAAAAERQVADYISASADYLESLLGEHISR